jgi:hypothetical protein
MNMEERQHPRQLPQGTSAPPFPDRSEASMPRSHAEKLPAGTGATSPEGPPAVLRWMPIRLVMGLV